MLIKKTINVKSTLTVCSILNFFELPLSVALLVEGINK